MAGDIEEFLRRAAQRRAQQQKPRPQPTAPPTLRPKSIPPRPIQPLEAEIIDDIEIIEPDVLHGSSVEAHVKEHIRTNVFGERVSHLGEDVDRSDDRMEKHLHEYFEHELGALGARTSTAEDSSLDDDSPGQRPKPQKPTNYLELLRNPASVRQAIILSEILTRPSDRW
ncbi:MAG: hypothetical protein H6822_12395 [Planctomycetaceae bacterium]|nr:hypothetical protein [Planctomycetales bacterium]MCB9922976.1 hypothetical protein [Planctomycetaceae bacterium]